MPGSEEHLIVWCRIELNFPVNSHIHIFLLARSKMLSGETQLIFRAIYLYMLGCTYVCHFCTMTLAFLFVWWVTLSIFTKQNPLVIDHYSYHPRN